MQQQLFKRAKPLDKLPSWFLAFIGAASIPITLFLVFVMVDVLPDFLVKLWDVGLSSSALNLLVLLLILNGGDDLEWFDGGQMRQGFTTQAFLDWFGCPMAAQFIDIVMSINLPTLTFHFLSAAKRPCWPRLSSIRFCQSSGGLPLASIF